ncbi:Mrp/NBP35 family ATP-binding protein [Bdellovibrio bacteriovorus]|uniref:Iron-sulfur cluster carrier protein n=1 Tax=Bdellovibrio bacteriovorus TaxID=959 RepID=A0A1Z3NAG7_BDEBC|nr:Mrp/NBP35 family ATP-binding protein [Bdellovibrio bacteriovorus]ASD64421.1 ATP-binding protein [Bdellovibrio bacteriovorus]
MAAPNPFEKQTAIPGVKHIIAVSSGKGGVGKSTVATNLAMALGRKGGKVGLLDADIYGPSIPRMLGTLAQKPQINPDTNQLEPVVRYGIKLMSIGFLVEEGAAVVWRGPMLFKAMDQFLRDVNWGELDYLVVDLPPGTGDIQLTLAQKVPVSGAVMVSTPQNVALVDVKKAVDMFARVNVPLLGMVENMAYMINPANGEKMQLFPKGEIDSYAQSKGINKLGEIPFNPSVGLACEAGIPIVEANSNGAEAQAFMKIADEIRELLPV